MIAKIQETDAALADRAVDLEATAQTLREEAVRLESLARQINPESSAEMILSQSGQASTLPHLGNVEVNET
jgi:hypothetical protein